MKGCQLAGFTALAASAMNTSTTATLTSTMTSLKLADSLTPITSSVVTMATMSTAGRLKIAEVNGPPAIVAQVAPAAAATGLPPASGTQSPCAAASSGGMWIPRFFPTNDTT